MLYIMPKFRSNLIVGVQRLVNCALMILKHWKFGFLISASVCASIAYCSKKKTRRVIVSLYFCVIRCVSFVIFYHSFIHT